MAIKRIHSETQIIEQYRIALENVQNQPEIAAAMAELGYDPDTLAKGNALWKTAENIYHLNKTEDDETAEAYAEFARQKAELVNVYRLHRKKAKVIFRKEPLILEKIGIKGRIPQAYIKWLEAIKKFYAVVSTDKEIQKKLTRLKITADEITQTKDKIAHLETARAEYLREKGESQDATKAKDQALANLEDWMSEFYAVAKIALEDHPQLMESLSKVVKS